MEFEWDKNKNELNIKKHELDFIDAWMIFKTPMLEKIDDRKTYGEERKIALGKLNNSVVIIVYTLRGNKIRIISLRRANHHEREIYQQTFS